MDKEKRLKRLLRELEERTGMDTYRLEKELIPHKGEETGLKTRKRKKI